MKLTTRKILTFTLLVVAVHFSLTLATEYRITVQVSDQTDKIDKEIFDKIFKSPRNYPWQKLEMEVKALSQKKREKSEEVYRRWKIPTFVISLPITHFIAPPLIDFIKKRLDNFLSKNISGAQLRVETTLVVCTANLVNSFVFGLLVYAIIIIFNSNLSHNKRRRRTKNKRGRKSGRPVTSAKVSSVKKARS